VKVNIEASRFGGNVDLVSEFVYSFDEFGGSLVSFTPPEFDIFWIFGVTSVHFDFTSRAKVSSAGGE
jgi:hypothetical protein